MAIFSSIAAGAGAAKGIFSVGKKLFGGGSHKLNKSAFKNAGNKGVTVFKDAAFNGTSLTLTPEKEWIWLKEEGSINRDDISSVKVPPGLKITMWTGGPPIAPMFDSSSNAGDKKVYTESTRYIGGNINDRVDTLRVEYTDKAKRQIQQKKEAKKPYTDKNEVYSASSGAQKAGGSYTGIIVLILVALGFVTTN